MAVARRFLARGLVLSACLLVLAGAASAAAQQQGDGGIVTEQLRPPGPQTSPAPTEDDGSRDNRFKRAPFHTPFAPAAPELIPPVATELRPGARIRQLDKMTGRIRTVEVAAGAAEQIGRLRVRLEACRSPVDNAQHGTMAFVDIWDSKSADRTPVFSGWMFAESPALSAMDHPRYDVWVISCTTSEGDASSASR
jgi:hypothetical protein